MREALVVSCLSGVLFASGCSHDELQPFCEEAIVPEVATYPDCLSVEEALEALSRFQNDDEASTRSDQPVVADVEVLMRSDVSAATRSAEGDRPLAYIARFEGDGYAILNATAHYAPVVAYVPKGSLTVAEMVAAKEATDRGEDAETPTYIHARVVDYLLAAADGRISPDDELGENVEQDSESMQCVKLSSLPGLNDPVQLMNTTWHQDYPYNMYCGTLNGARMKVGCVALTLGQIILYNKQKFNVGPSKIAPEGLIFPPGTTIYYPQWSTLLPILNSAEPRTTVQQEELAEFLHALGVAVGMNYGIEISEALVQKAANFLCNSAQYSFAELRKPSLVDIKTQLKGYGTPVWASGQAQASDANLGIQKGGRHSWVIDGWMQKKVWVSGGGAGNEYQTNKDFLYCRYGYMNGAYDGWYQYESILAPSLYVYGVSEILYYTI